MSNIRILVSAVFVLLVTFLSGCSVNPATGQQQFVLLDEEDEAFIGKTAHPRILEAYGGAYQEGDVEAYVTSLVAHIVENSAQPDLPYTVTVLDSSLVNALALPGGYVYVTRGLLALANDEAELAGVIAHEIAHVNARHVAQRQTAAMGTSILGALVGSVLGTRAVKGIVSRGTDGLLASYSRAQESEADRLAVTYLARAGYDPYAVRDFLRAIRAYAGSRARSVGEKYDPAEVGWLSSHPATDERIENAGHVARELFGSGAHNRRGQAAYFKAINGMLFGESHAHGYIRDGDFIHVDERFRFSVPPHFRLANTLQAVWAIGPDKTIVKFDRATKAVDESLHQYLTRNWAAAMALEDVVDFKIGGLPAVSARSRLQGLATRIVAIEASPTRVYRFLAGVPIQVRDRYEAAFADMFQSFRLMSASEAASIHPLRVRIVKVAKGMTFESLAAQMAFRKAPLEQFQLLNGMSTDDPLIEGGYVKLIVEGR